MSICYRNCNRRPGEPAPRPQRRRHLGLIQKRNQLDINKSSRSFRMFMENISEAKVSKFASTDPTNRKTKRRNGRAKLKKFGDKQRTLYKMIVSEVSAAYPVYSSGTQPAHDFLRLYMTLSPSDYSQLFSAFQEHTYKTTRMYGWNVNEQVKILSRLGLHTTVNILLDIDRMNHSYQVYEQKRAKEVHNLLMLHYHYFLLILNHRTYSMLLEPITYDRIENITNDILEPAVNRNESIDELLGNNLRTDMEDVARTQQWLYAATNRAL